MLQVSVIDVTGSLNKVFIIIIIIIIIIIANSCIVYLREPHSI